MILTKPRRPPLLTIVVVLASAAGLAAGCWLAFRDRGGKQAASERSGGTLQAATDHIIDDWLPSPGFVGSKACRKCHAEQFDSFLETRHSRAMAEVLPQDEPPDAVVDHSATAHRYRTSRVEGRLVHEASLVLNDGTAWEPVRFPVRYRLGSGHLGRTYLVEDDGFLVQSPMTWYSVRDEWILSFGYETAGLTSFERVVSGSVLLC